MHLSRRQIARWAHRAFAHYAWICALCPTGNGWAIRAFPLMENPRRSRRTELPAVMVALQGEQVAACLQPEHELRARFEAQRGTQLAESRLYVA